MNPDPVSSPRNVTGEWDTPLSLCRFCVIKTLYDGCDLKRPDMFPPITQDDVFRIETPRLWLRWPHQKDAPALHAVASHAHVAEMTAGIPHPFPDGAAEAFIAKTRAQNRHGDSIEMVIERKSLSRDVIGTVFLRHQHAHLPVLGYALHPAWWRHGYATEAAKAVIDMGFLLTDWEGVSATVRADNPASIHVLAKLGFQNVGRRTDFLPLRQASLLVEDYQLARTTFHHSFGGALQPLLWDRSTLPPHWAGAA